MTRLKYTLGQVPALGFRPRIDLLYRLCVSPAAGHINLYRSRFKVLGQFDLTLYVLKILKAKANGLIGSLGKSYCRIFAALYPINLKSRLSTDLAIMV